MDSGEYRDWESKCWGASQKRDGKKYSEDGEECWKCWLLDVTWPTLTNFQQPWPCAQDLYKIKLVKRPAWMGGGSLAADRCWPRGNHFSVAVEPLVHWLCSCKWCHTRAHQANLIKLVRSSKKTGRQKGHLWEDWVQGEQCGNKRVVGECDQNILYTHMQSCQRINFKIF